MASLTISKKEAFKEYVDYIKSHPERPKNAKVTIEVVEEILSIHNVLFTKQPPLKSKVRNSYVCTYI